MFCGNEHQSWRGRATLILFMKNNLVPLPRIELFNQSHSRAYIIYPRFDTKSVLCKKRKERGLLWVNNRVFKKSTVQLENIRLQYKWKNLIGI